MSRCAEHTLSLVNVASDLNIELHPTIHTDASAALSIAHRSGAGGRSRHVKVQYLWVQGAVSRKDLRVAKVGTSENPADMLTKFPQCRVFGSSLQERRLRTAGRQLPGTEGERQAGRVF